MDARTLDVYLHREFIGHLMQDDEEELRFTYAPSWLDNPNRVALSHSLPLRTESFPSKECRGFFGGILPDLVKRETIARNLHISGNNDFAMLEQIGGECAGAVTFIPAGKALPPAKGRYRAVEEPELARLLKMLPRRPLLAGEGGIRLSLAGAQDKIAVHLADGKISIPLGEAPSTHILKPAIADFEGTVFNEALCMNLARAIGLPVARAMIGNAAGLDYLLVERYDRKMTPHGIQRLHQEDFCQALGIAPNRKYQQEGGPSLEHCFNLIREVSSAPVLDLQDLLDAVIFNFLAGNHDAHGKNFSLLYELGKETRLAPLYDLLCTAYYPAVLRNMAMRIGGEYASDKIGPEHFGKMAQEAGLTRPLVLGRVVELGHNIIAGLPEVTQDDTISRDVARLIRGRCEQTLSRFKK